MKRTILTAITLAALCSCGPSQAEKESLQAQKEYLKAEIRSANAYIDSYNERIKATLGEHAATIDIKIDTVHYFERIDAAKVKNIDAVKKNIESMTKSTKELCR